MSDWSDILKGMDADALTWSPPFYGTELDFDGIKTDLVVQYVVDYQTGDNFLLNVEVSLDGQHWTRYDSTPYVAGFSLGSAAVSAGTATAVLHVNDYPFRHLRFVGTNLNTGGAPLATAFVSAR